MTAWYRSAEAILHLSLVCDHTLAILESQIDRSLVVCATHHDGIARSSRSLVIIPIILRSQFVQESGAMVHQSCGMSACWREHAVGDD